jgi:polyisoprenoid-binding protein YceI
MSATATQPLAAGTWKIDKVHSHVGFAVKHMAVATFRGRFESYDGSLSFDEAGAPHLQGSVDVDSIVVKDENLAAHLKSPDFFDSANYPRISFSSSDVSVGQNGELEVRGELTIRDHTHELTGRGAVTGPHTDLGGTEKIGIELEAVIDRRDYGIEFSAELPSGGLAVEHDVKLEVSLELARES